MKRTHKLIVAFLAVIACLFASVVMSAQIRTGAITGVVTDPSGAVVPEAQITVVTQGGQPRAATSDARSGRFAFPDLPAGEYRLRINAQGFAPYEATGLHVGPGATVIHNATLAIEVTKQEVNVGDTKPLDVEPTENASALTLKGSDLNSLSDDPDDLAEDLQALAGPAAGPNGGEIFVDGFSGATLPPKSSIREIRVNQNPFSAEYDRLGYGRIEIFTKPGTDRLRGTAFFNFGDSVFNSRNPYVPDKPHYQRRMFEGTVGGPLTRQSSFFLQVERRNIEETSLINAQTLDSSLNIVPFREAVITPTVNTEISSRIDYQLTTNNTLIGRYEWESRTQENAGLDTFTLPSRAYGHDNGDHVLQLTETAVLSPRSIHELRFQYRHGSDISQATSFAPAVQVAEAFSDGGASVGFSSSADDHWELSDVLSLSRNRHMLKVGGRIRGVKQSNRSTQNYNGLFTFTSIDVYQMTQQGIHDGLTPEQIRALGGGPSQFTLTAGDPLADVSQVDAGVFMQEDWRVRSQLTLSGGVRYEIQTNISDHRSIAPRVGFAWAVGGGGKKQPIAVIRGGFGMFYDRVGESLTLQAKQLNGTHQIQYVVPSPDFYPNIPALDLLAANIRQQAIRIKANNLRAPYTAQAAFSAERQLPKNITVSLTYTNSRGVHTLRSRNINAPLPGTYDPSVPTSGIRPFSGGNIYQYESTGVFRQNQVIVNVNARINRRYNLFGFYSWSKANSDTDGAGSFPVDQYDAAGDYGRAGFDARHRGMIGASVTTFYGVTLSPFIVASSGGPFNITVGRDLNGDSLFNDRPAWATDLTRLSVVRTAWGDFDTAPLPGQIIIPRNLGTAPGQFTVNLRVSKSFAFGARSGERSQAADQPRQVGPPMGGGPGGGHGPGGPGGGHGPGGPGGWGGHGGGPGGSSAINSRYSLTFSASARNLFNHVNPGAPIGNLSSPLFGTSVALGGFGHRGGGTSANRALELQLRFSF